MIRHTGFLLRLCNRHPSSSSHLIQGSNNHFALKTSSVWYHASIHSSSSGVNGSSSASGSRGEADDIIESASANTQWKRNQYRKLEDKFNNNNENESKHTSSTKQQLEPLNIDNYDDVQPMWKEMESRVTRRRSLTLEQRGGVSGRRNVRKSEEDYWQQAGVYDGKKTPPSS
jgi:ribosomal protein L11 methylase PrmA